MFVKKNIVHVLNVILPVITNYAGKQKYGSTHLFFRLHIIFCLCHNTSGYHRVGIIYENKVKVYLFIQTILLLFNNEGRKKVRTAGGSRFILIYRLLSELLC